MNAVVSLDSKGSMHAGLEALLVRSRTTFERRGVLSCEERIDALRRLEKAVYARRLELAAAISADFGGRAYEETLSLEIFGVLDEIRATCKHLKRWMRPRRVASNWQFRPSRSRIIAQPLGVVGIIGAFNYPVHLTLSPMIGAIAAGNHVIAKPSEATPRVAALLQQIVGELYRDDYVSIVVGDAELSRAFAQLPFDHLLFTGSSRVGKLIMREAAANLTPVTLELGGKSPAIVARGYPLRKAVEDICFAKLLNAGQTCVAPDYVLVPEECVEDFVALAAETIARYYPRLVDNPDYTRLISAREHARLSIWVDEARARGARITVVNPGGEACTAESRVFAPTLVAHCPDDAALMQNELFGPVLPIVGYRTLDDAIARVNAAPRPLALYYFDQQRAGIDQVLASTISGGVTVNGCVYHVGQHALPFGGVGNSGIGHYHGEYGFNTFSKLKPVFEVSRFANTRLLRPPFGTAIQWVIGILLSNRLRREHLPDRGLADRA